MYNKEFEEIFAYANGKVDDIEILLVSNDNFSVRIHEQEIEAFNYSDEKGLGIRIIKDGKVGYAYTEKFDSETFRKIVDKALENSKFTVNDEVPIMENYPDIPKKPNVFSDELEKVGIDKKVEFAKNLEKYAKEFDKRIFNVPYAMMGSGKTYSKIANSKGLNKEDIQNYAYSYAGVLAGEKDDKRMGMDFIISRNFRDFDAKKLAEESCRKALDLLGGQQIESGKYPIVFNNEMMATLLATFSGIFSAKTVYEGKSLLKGKINELIANEKVTIIDDALHPDGLSTQAFDSEGYPAQTTVLVDKGKLVSYLHNTETARKFGVKSTGNGSRGYKSSLTVSPTNFFLKAGNLKENELFGKRNRIIEIVSLQGMHSGANAISGDFSLSAEGFLWENGIRKYSLKPFTISGNILQLLHDVEAIADNFRFNMSSVGAASTLIKELTVAG
ncbi:MAG: hypothetical protein B6D62_03615 [Candidatus Cloacimonas sp. 4484_275]|nr:MAG: hypothetical protein B6D62_03615 [Candidatus Cloacimonas sp. 4484_275]